MKKFLQMILVFLTGALIVMVFFYAFHKTEKTNICLLQNNSNICFINAPIQTLFCCKKLRKFLKDQIQHNNKKIRALSELFTQMEISKNLDPYPFYDIIFKDSKTIKLNKKKGSYTETYVHIVQLINGNFLQKNFFFDPNQIAENENRIISEIFLILKEDSKISDILSKKLSECIKKNQQAPEIFFLHQGLLSESYRTSASFEVPVSITSFKSTYQLVAQLIKTSGRDKITNEPISHIFAQCKFKNKWWRIDDKNKREIEEKKLKEMIYKNKDSRILIYIQEGN